MQSEISLNRDVPSVSAITAPSTTNFATSGSRRVTLEGFGFGQHDFSPIASAGFTNGMFSIWISESSLNLKYSTGLPNNDHVLIVSCDIQRGSITKLFSFDVAVISIIRQTNFVVTGSVLATIFGRSYGYSSFSPKCRSMLLTFVTSAAEDTLWRADSATVTK